MHAVSCIFQETFSIWGWGGICVQLCRRDKVLCIIMEVQSGSNKRLPVVLPLAPQHRGEALPSTLAYYKLKYWFKMHVHDQCNLVVWWRH